MKEAEKIEKSEQKTKSVRSSKAVVALLCMFVPRTRVRECIKKHARNIYYIFYIYMRIYKKIYIIYNIYFIIIHMSAAHNSFLILLIAVARRRFSYYYYLYTSSHAIARAFETILYDFYDRSPVSLNAKSSVKSFFMRLIATTLV